MALTIRLENERGEPLETVFDAEDVLPRLLPSLEDELFQCLRFIDWYGDTAFNRLQMDVFLSEWERVKGRAKTKQEQEILTKVERLALECQREVHLYLKLYGD